MADGYERVSSCFEEICDAAMYGRIEALPELEQRLIAALSESDLPQDGPELEALTQQLERSRQLLTAARRGVQVVQRRLGEIRRIALGLDTYDAGGQLSQRSDTGASLSRRF